MALNGDEQEGYYKIGGNAGGAKWGERGKI